VDGGSPTDSRRLEVSTGFDLAPIDTRVNAVRLVGTIDYKDERVQDLHTIEKDQFTLGLRYDQKFVVKSKIARAFGGGFLEGGLWTRAQKVTPTRVLTDVVDPVNADVRIPTLTSSGKDLPYRLAPRRYRSFGVGFEVADVAAWPHAKVTDFQVRVDMGRSRNDLAGATLNGDALDAMVLARDGIGEALKKHYTDVARRQPLETDVVALHYASPRPQRRVQTTVKTDHPIVKWNGSDITIGQEFVHRYYHVSDPVAFSFRWSVHEKLSLTLPIPWRLKAVIAGEFDMASLQALDGHFEVFRLTAGFEFPVFAKVSRAGRLAR
jgi:hypothetical protein